MKVAFAWILFVLWLIAFAFVIEHFAFRYAWGVAPLLVAGIGICASLSYAVITSLQAIFPAERLDT